MSTVKELQATLDTMSPDDPIAWTIWNREDVALHAQQMGVSLIRGDVEDILHTLHDRQNANDGTCWGTVESVIRESLETTRQQQVINITVKSGCVIAVDNLPENSAYQIVDLDG